MQKKIGENRSQVFSGQSSTGQALFWLAEDWPGTFLAGLRPASYFFWLARKQPFFFWLAANSQLFSACCGGLCCLSFDRQTIMVAAQTARIFLAAVQPARFFWLLRSQPDFFWLLRSQPDFFWLASGNRATLPQITFKQPFPARPGTLPRPDA